MHQRMLLFQGHCWDNYNSSKQIFQSSPSTPALQELFRVCTDSVTSRVHRCGTAEPQRVVLRMQRRSVHFYCDSPSKATPEGPRHYCAKPVRPLNRGYYLKTKHIWLSKHQPDRYCSDKGRKAVADEPWPVLSLAPFCCKSLRINIVKQFKIAFSYPSSTSIVQLSQGTVILPMLLSHSLLPMCAESFSSSLPSPSPLPDPSYFLQNKNSQRTVTILDL